MQAILRQIVNGTLGSTEPDAELLRRFAAERDPDAFGQLVRRYGGLVWGLCRHLLASEADADDAFQATFLALAKSAGTIRSADRLGPWLHGVAYRVCRNARRQAARRARREQATARTEANRPVADSAWDALLAAVHEELHGLPDKLRVAFILCYLEGKATTEAAEQVGVKLGTFSARLSRAKEQLLARLSARGLAAGAGVLAAMTGGPASAALVERAVELAVASSGVPAVILTLTNGVLLMGVTKLKIAATVGLLVGVLALGGLWSLQAQPPGGDTGGGATPMNTAFPSQPGVQPPPTETARLQREIDLLRTEIAKKEAELRQREAERLAKEKKAKTPEFRYLPQRPGYAPTADEFEKAVREVEKDGYRLVGVVTMAADAKPTDTGGPGGPRGGTGGTAGVPTLVFRKPQPIGGGMMGGFGGGIGGFDGGPGGFGGGGFNPGPGGAGGGASGGRGGPGDAGGSGPGGPGAGRPPE